MAIKKGILIAFGELFLKSEGVKKILQRRLLNNLKSFLEKKVKKFKIYPFRGRIFLETDLLEESFEVLKKLFGISWITESFFLEKASLEEIAKFVTENYQEWIKKEETFALRVRRDKSETEKSETIIKDVAAEINRKVSLDRPDREIFIERRKAGWFIYFTKERAAGGLPVGSSGKVLSLISGGIDSPPAAYLLAKRGAENIWVHFHSYPLVSKASIEKVKDLAQVFLDYQPKLKVYLVPFGEIQSVIKTKTEAKYRVLLYRRLMLQMAEEISQKEKCKALVTGESLGQVSSQTLTNIQITDEAVKLSVFRPLIGWDKQEIINLAKEIGTYDISIKPQEDCCTLFVPKHATAEGKLTEVIKIEKELDLNSTVEEAISKMEVLEY